MRKAPCLALVVAFTLSMRSIGAHEVPSFGNASYRYLLSAVYGQLVRFAGFLAPGKLRFLTDGGDGGGSSGDGSGSSSGDGGSGGAGDSGGTAGAAGAATGDGDSSGGDGDGSDGEGTDSGERE